MPDPAPRPHAVFDFDGVLVRRDSTAELIGRRLRRRPWLLPLTAVPLAAYAATAVVPPLQAPASRVVVRAALAGTTSARTAAAGRLLGAELAGDDRVRVDGAVARMREHLAEGDVTVVSAGLAPTVRARGLEVDRGTRGPVVDAALRTSEPGVFAVGNLLHPVDTADVAALDGRHVADAWLAESSGAGSGDVVPDISARFGPETGVSRWELSGTTARAGAAGRGRTPGARAAGVRLRVEAPLRWVAPQLVDPTGPAPARGRLLLWTDAWVARPRVEVVQDGRIVSSRRLPWPAAPGRVFRVPSSVLDGVRATGGDVTLRLG